MLLRVLVQQKTGKNYLSIFWKTFTLSINDILRCVIHALLESPGHSHGILRKENASPHFPALTFSFRFPKGC